MVEVVVTGLGYPPTVVMLVADRRGGEVVTLGVMTLSGDLAVVGGGGGPGGVITIAVTIGA